MEMEMGIANLIVNPTLRLFCPQNQWQCCLRKVVGPTNSQNPRVHETSDDTSLYKITIR